MNRRQQVENQATEILKRAGAYQIPVPVKSVARELKLRVEEVQLGDHISGLLVVDDGGGTIGYNQDHATVRQRFTIAHEIGHFVLHFGQRSLFIDKRFTEKNSIYLRNERSSTGEDSQEVDANGFAAALLMPREFVLREVPEGGLDVADDDTLRELARKFEVSSQAMAFRLAGLGLLGSTD